MNLESMIEQAERVAEVEPAHRGHRWTCVVPGCGSQPLEYSGLCSEHWRERNPGQPVPERWTA